ALEQTIERRAREVDMLVAELASQRNSHALLGQQVNAVRELADKGLYPRLRLVAIERQLSDAAGDISESRSRLLAAQAALAEAESRRDGLEREWRANLLTDLAAARAERDRLAQAQKRLLATQRNLVVRAPVDGIVQELAVTTPGQSVGSNQPLMKIVPTGGGLVIEARVDNRDIGYLRVGQAAKVKVLAYDFLRYGELLGHIERIAADATLDPASRKPDYKIVIRTDGDQLGSRDRPASVVPGMTVDVDLLVGERTILSYLTDRIFRLREAAFREG
ncbi:MAG: HlyD family type I secretion periplasmic adaptor subunit, partial [Geminicoccaceae bacterium]